MPTRLERQWWFVAPVTLCSAMLCNLLLAGAGWSSPHGWAQWMVYGLVFVGLQRGLSFTGWLLVLWLHPASVVSAPARRADTGQNLGQSVALEQEQI